jgi:ABC-2 type transport system ATP-binding protein
VIHVSHLTKYYGDYAAVRDVSFDVPKGRVFGFLGPNGAGKSTTMRVLAGYLTATSGRATIDGIDVFWNPVEVRRRIGYMPENCPLYPEMRVAEYLWFRGGVKGLHGGACRRRVEYVLQRCWLTDVRRQLIGTLSKGYRQRVALAQALVHDPKVLVLDEPTAGLDPRQVAETRELIAKLGRTRSVLLSSHLLSEVANLCRRVVVLDKGRVLAVSDVATLTASVGTRLELRVSGDPQRAVRVVTGISGVEEASVRGDLVVVKGTGDDLGQRVAAAVIEGGIGLLEQRVTSSGTLEEAYLNLVRE